jgi:hypothetical protein
MAADTVWLTCALRTSFAAFGVGSAGAAAGNVNSNATSIPLKWRVGTSDIFGLPGKKGGH